MDRLAKYYIFPPLYGAGERICSAKWREIEPQRIPTLATNRTCRREVAVEGNCTALIIVSRSQHRSEKGSFFFNVRLPLSSRQIFENSIAWRSKIVRQLLDMEPASVDGSGASGFLSPAASHVGGSNMGGSTSKTISLVRSCLKKNFRRDVLLTAAETSRTTNVVSPSTPRRSVAWNTTLSTTVETWSPAEYDRSMREVSHRYDS